VPTSRGPEWRRAGSLVGARSDPWRRLGNDKPDEAGFPSARAVRRLAVSVAVVSVTTVAVAMQALTVALGGPQELVPITALVLMPVLWVCSAGVYRSRRRGALAYTQCWQRLNAFAGTANEVLWEITADGVITYVAPHAQTLLGCAPTELYGRRVDEVLVGHERKRAHELLAASITGRHGWTDEQFTMLSRDGRAKHMWATACIRLGADGTPIGFTGTLREAEPQPLPARAAELLRASVEAILNDRPLRSLYQPILSTTGLAVIGAEALTRFSTTPSATPDVWFARAAEVGLGTDLELLALTTALESAEQLPSHIYLSINLSPDALADPRTSALLEQSSWPPHQLVVEITEHVSVTDYATLADAVMRLRRLGVRIAVDDAGAGYASFRHILKLRPDYIKLDRALVDGLDDDPAKRALAGAFVAFGGELDALIVAEGVETAAELAAVTDLGVHAVQGFHTGRPAPPGPGWGL
jgi:PAS domain S-box-containing protein